MKLTASPRVPGYPHTSVTVDFSALERFFEANVRAHVTYKLGTKINHEQVPGRDYKTVDCSGFVREAVYVGTAGCLDLSAGSWYQEEDVKGAGFKQSLPDACFAEDGVLRIAFLPKVGDGERHVVLVRNGWTMESHGGHGVDRRKWGSCGWMNKCSVYVLTRPGG